MENHSSPDEIAIRSLFDRMRAAWAAGDAMAYANCFSPDSDYVTFNGIHLRGRNENASLHAALFRRVLKGTQLSIAVKSLTLLAPDVALIHTTGSGPKRGGRAPRAKSLQTFVAVRRDAQWLIRAFQNTRMQPFSVWFTRLIAPATMLPASARTRH